jgi:hypothetical protein
VIGSADDDRLRVDEVSGRLPLFAGQTPSVNNLGIGGGSANPSHLNAAGDLLLTTLFGGTWDASDVTIHFDGGSGVDSIDLNLLTCTTRPTPATAMLPTAATWQRPAAAGLPHVVCQSGSAELEWRGGSLWLMPPVRPRRACDDQRRRRAADGWSQVDGNNGGRPASRLHAALCRRGDGSELIDILGLDSVTTLTNAQLRGGSTADFLSLVGGNDVSSDLSASAARRRPASSRGRWRQ